MLTNLKYWILRQYYQRFTNRLIEVYGITSPNLGDEYITMGGGIRYMGNLKYLIVK
jgi:hypothetical protein